MKKPIVAALLTLLAAVLAAPAVVQAHHSPASFDLTRRTTLTGVIHQSQFRNPHGRMLLDVRTGNRVVRWEVETSAANLLRRRGWVFSRFRAGTTVTVYGHLNKTVPNYIYVREARFADGTFFGDSEGNDQALD